MYAAAAGLAAGLKDVAAVDSLNVRVFLCKVHECVCVCEVHEYLCVCRV